MPRELVLQAFSLAQKFGIKQVDKGQISVAGQIEPSGQFVSTQVNLNPGQFVSTLVSLFQPRSVWGRYKTQVTGHCFTNTESILNIH